MEGRITLKNKTRVKRGKLGVYGNDGRCEGRRKKYEGGKFKDQNKKGRCDTWEIAWTIEIK